MNKINCYSQKRIDKFCNDMHNNLNEAFAANCPNNERMTKALQKILRETNKLWHEHD